MSSSAVVRSPPEAVPVDVAVTGARAEAFARAHVDFAWRVARRLGLTAADAEDVAQKAMLIATSKLNLVNPGSEQAFVFSTVANLVSKVFRSRRRHPEEPEDAAPEPIDHEANPEHLLEQRRARQTLDAILASISADLRAAFVLFEIEGLSQPEIAEALAIPVGTVASRLRRAREEFTRAAVRRGVLSKDGRSGQ